MSYERRSQIYVTHEIGTRLFLVRDLHPEFFTVEDVVGKILNESIERDYPEVIELEKKLAQVKREAIEKAKNTEGKL
jgi:hypothetical protein